jgi:integrative and conjugative element protein (TIGR02256 family)
MGAGASAKIRLRHLQMELTCLVDVPRPLLDRIIRLAGASADGRETGGILLGHGPSPDGLISVTHVGDPGPAAERRADFFLRDLHHSRRLAASAWLADGSDWIGEWHTHPAGGPQPSTRDLHTYTRILAGTPAFHVFLSLIVTPARDGGWSEPQVNQWLISRGAEHAEHGARADPTPR